jgi:hypothetical protein
MAEARLIADKTPRRPGQMVGGFVGVGEDSYPQSTPLLVPKHAGSQPLRLSATGLLRRRGRRPCLPSLRPFARPFATLCHYGGAKPCFGHLEKNALLAFTPGCFGPAHATRQQTLDTLSTTTCAPPFSRIKSRTGKAPLLGRGLDGEGTGTRRLTPVPKEPTQNYLGKKYARSSRCWCAVSYRIMESLERPVRAGTLRRSRRFKRGPASSFTGLHALVPPIEPRLPVSGAFFRPVLVEWPDQRSTKAAPDRSR